MFPMRRRSFFVVPLALAGDAGLAEVPALQPLDPALRWLDRLPHAGNVRTLGVWPLGAVLEHLAQSVEMSMDGYPRQRSRLLQDTAGSAAFAFFQWRGKMNHDLAEPIPGAPALTAIPDWRPGAQRLREAIVRFRNYNGELKPHFAYGPLSKSEYALAHAMHIANHRDEIQVA
jgi:hypothetical protein